MKVAQYLIVILMIISCNSGQFQTTKTFKTIIPDTSKIHGKNLNAWRIDANIKFNLPLIHSGVDSFELRFWTSIGLPQPSSVTILTYSDSNWVAKHAYLYNGLIEDSLGQHEVFDKLMVDDKEIRSSMRSIIYYLEEFHIEALPSQGELPDFVDTTRGGSYYTIELATKHYYKLLSYHNPESYLKQKDNKKMTELIKFLYEHL